METNIRKKRPAACLAFKAAKERDFAADNACEQLPPHLRRVELGFAAVLELENREVDDLEAAHRSPNSESDNLAAVHIHLLRVRRTVIGRDWTKKKRPGNLTDFAVRRYLERKGSLEELIVALYCGTVSMSRVEKVAKTLWGDEADAGLISRHAREIERRLQQWIERPILMRYPYVFLRVMLLKAGKGDVKSWRRIFVAVGVSFAGIREVLSVRIGAPWGGMAHCDFLGDLQKRGLVGTQLFVGPNDTELISAVEERFPGTRYQGDFAQMEREVLQATPPNKILEASEILAAIRNEISPECAKVKLASLLVSLRQLQNSDAARILASAMPFLYNFSEFPRPHWARLQTYSPLARVMRDCREWNRVGGAVTIPEDFRLAAAARWRHASRVWARQKFLSFDPPAPRSALWPDRQQPD